MSSRVFGTLRLGASDIALEADVLQEVVSLSGSLSPALRAPAWSLGTFVLRDHPIPVVDLSVLLDLTTPDRATRTQHVAVVAYRGARFGLVVERACDVVTVASSRLHPVDRQTETVGKLTPWVFSRTNEQRTVYVLDIEVLFKLDGMISVSEAATSVSEDRSRRASVKEDSSDWALIVEAGDLRLAIDTAVVREIAPGDTLTEPVTSVPGYLGNQQLRGESVPVFDPQVLLGQTGAATARERIVILTADQGAAALAATRAVGIIDYSRGDCLPLPGENCAMAHVHGLLHLDVPGDALLLNHGSLFADGAFPNLARIYASLHLNSDDDSNKAQGDGSWQRFAFLYFDAGGQYAVPLDQIEAVVVYPDTVTAYRDDTRFIGAFTHRKRTVSLIDLRELLGRSTESAPTHVLIVNAVDMAVGFAVDIVREMKYMDAPSNSLKTTWSGGQRSNRAIVDRCKQLVSLGFGERRQFLSVLNLQVLAADLICDAPQQASVEMFSE